MNIKKKKEKKKHSHFLQKYTTLTHDILDILIKRFINLVNIIRNYPKKRKFI